MHYGTILPKWQFSGTEGEGLKTFVPPCINTWTLGLRPNIACKQGNSVKLITSRWRTIGEEWHSNSLVSECPPSVVLGCTLSCCKHTTQNR